MKKLLLTLSSSLLVIFVFGQNTSGTSSLEKPFRFGLKASPSLAWMKSAKKEYDNKGAVFGISYGFVGDFSIASNYSFVIGMNINYTGGKLQYSHSQKIQLTDTVAVNGMLERKYTVKYIEIPLILKMRTNEVGYITYYGQIGLGSSFRLSAKADDTFEYQGGVLTSNDNDIKDDVSFFRESLIIGLGIEYALGGSTSFLAGITFNNGFTDILSGRNSVNPDLKEQAISNFLEINLGILF